MTNLHLSNYASNLWTIVEARARREVTYYHGIGEKLLPVLTDSALKSLFFVFSLKRQQKKFINIKVRKMSVLALNYTFFGSKKAKTQIFKM